MVSSALIVGDAILLDFDGGFHQSVAGLFVAAELNHPQDPYGHHRYRAKVGVMLERMTALGFGHRRAIDELANSLEAWLAEQTSYPLFDEVDLPPASVESTLELMAKCIQGSAGFRDPTSVPVERLDPRTQTRLLLDQVTDPDLEVEYVLNGLIEHAGGACVDLAAQSRAEASLHPSGATPTVVLTEGRNDAELLSLAMKYTHPHLVEHLRFMDFDEMKREGGAGIMLSLVKGLASAGISNRFVAIADNDAAGRSALASAPELPENFRLLHYPPSDLLKNYPTLGPQSTGIVTMDVNGLAGSLEMYLGVDVLAITPTATVSPTTERASAVGSSHEANPMQAAKPLPAVDTALFPVEWAGYQNNVKAYQGSLGDANKKLVHQRFKKKVADAKAGTGAPGADWEGVRAIINTIVNAFEPSP